MKLPFIFLVLLLVPLSFKAQEVFSLSDCIAMAREENIALKQGELDVQIESENLKQARANRYPTLNGIATNNYNFGQRIDPFTNQFASTRVRSNSFSLNTDVDIFRGRQIYNGIKQQENDYLISQKRLEVLSNDIALNIAGAYLQILLQKEIVTLMSNEVEITNKQRNQTQVLIESGSLAEGELLNIESQLAQNEANLVAAENELSINVLELKQLMRFPLDKELILDEPSIDVNTESAGLLQTDYIYSQSEQNLPQIKVAEYTLESSDKALDVAKGSRSPVVRLGASYGTGYSGASKQVIGSSFAGLTRIGETATGEDVFTNQFNTVTQTIPFSDQLSNNINQTVGISLTIPIFNNFSSSTSINIARLRNEQAALNLEQSKQDLRNEVERARNDAATSFSNFQALLSSKEALERSYQYSKERFDAGLLRVLDLNQEQNNLIRAESELLQAKYNYVFKLKVLDFYLGKPISL